MSKLTPSTPLSSGYQEKKIQVSQGSGQVKPTAKVVFDYTWIATGGLVHLGDDRIADSLNLLLLIVELLHLQRGKDDKGKIPPKRT